MSGRRCSVKCWIRRFLTPSDDLHSSSSFVVLDFAPATYSCKFRGATRAFILKPPADLITFLPPPYQSTSPTVLATVPHPRCLASSSRESLMAIGSKPTSASCAIAD